MTSRHPFPPPPKPFRENWHLYTKYPDEKAIYNLVSILCPVRCLGLASGKRGVRTRPRKFLPWQSDRRGWPTLHYSSLHPPHTTPTLTTPPPGYIDSTPTSAYEWTREKQWRLFTETACVCLTCQDPRELATLEVSSLFPPSCPLPPFSSLFKHIHWSHIYNKHSL